MDVSVKTSEPAKSANLWTADSPSTEFITARWTAAPISDTDYSSTFFSGQIEKPATGHRAAYAELEFDDNGRSFSETTSIGIATK